MPGVSHSLRIAKGYAQPAIPFPSPAARVLVLTPSLEVRLPLVRTLESLPADVVTCSNLAQAREALLHLEFDLVFCDECLLEDAGLGVLQLRDASGKPARLVITTRSSGWDVYFHALDRGAYDVVRAPWYATDLEMVVIRAVRERASGSASPSPGVRSATA